MTHSINSPNIVSGLIPSYTVYEDTEKPHDYCGLAGSLVKNGLNASNVVVEMGKALQHRGQNGGGLAVKAPGKLLKVYKKNKAFNEIFHSLDVIEDNSLRGEIAIAHLRYPTEGSSRQNCDAQPFYASYNGWELALGHNGSIVGVDKHRNKLKKLNIELDSDSDSEILAWLIVSAPGVSWRQKVRNALQDVQGAYSLVMVTGDEKLLALRDPWGVRPLVWSQDNGHVFVSSETCALDRISIRHSQKLEPGELLIAEKDGVTITKYLEAKKQSFCVFEKLYFSQETSLWDGVTGENRENLGKELAKEEVDRIRGEVLNKKDIEKIDFIVAVPDTARPGSLSFSENLRNFLKADGLEIKFRYFRGLVKERYDFAKRTFIEDDPYLRRKHIEKKFFVSPTIIGKSIYLIDDTAVRLNTYKILVEHLQKIGVKEIHCRFLAPKFIHPCFLGVNIGSREELGAVKKEKDGRFRVLTEDEIKKKLKVASVHYLSFEGMARSLETDPNTLRKTHCTGCLDYNNPFSMQKYDKEYSKTPYAKIKVSGKKPKIFIGHRHLAQ